MVALEIKNLTVMVMNIVHFYAYSLTFGKCKLSSMQCTSPHCPSNNIVTERYQTTFSLPSSLSGNFKDINTIFPLPGDIIGYCGSEFNKSPPKEAPHAVTDRIDVISKKRSQFFECRGNFRVTSASFITLKKQNFKSTQELVESPKICMAILTICSNLIILWTVSTLS